MTKLWNIGNTTLRNPERLREALKLFLTNMQGRPFSTKEQLEYLIDLIDTGQVTSSREEIENLLKGVNAGANDPSFRKNLQNKGTQGRKFASAFKQLGFITDWADGKAWQPTPMGKQYVRPSLPEDVEERIFLRQLLKYQLPSPLEKIGYQDFRVRPFRLLLRFLKRAHDEGLVGLTYDEIGLFVITVITEDDSDFEQAFAAIKTFRQEYEARAGKVAKRNFVRQRAKALADELKLNEGTFYDYADSSSRYARMTGLLTFKGNKLAILDTRRLFVEALLNDGSALLPEDQYLKLFYNPDFPALPSDNFDFLSVEIQELLTHLQKVSAEAKEPYDLPAMPITDSLSELQTYESLIRKELKRIRELLFYRRQPAELDQIIELLENIRDDDLPEGKSYRPAYFEWAIWRLFLAINNLEGPIEKTRGFKVDDEMNPLHHAQGGAADLTFTYADFVLLCEMTLVNGSRQFAMEGEPVTRHVYKAITENQGKRVYGLFIPLKLDPNTADAFHKARFWSAKDWKTPIPTPVVALEFDQILALVKRLQTKGNFTPKHLQALLDEILARQDCYDNGPTWFQAYSTYYEAWIKQT
jgi:hypothetical protein